MAKYLKINGKVCLDTWQGMLTSQKRRISALRTVWDLRMGLHFTQLLSLLYTIRPISFFLSLFFGILAYDYCFIDKRLTGQISHATPCWTVCQSNSHL